MPLNWKETYQTMLQKGFSDAPNKSPDHKWIEFWHKGKLTRAKTKFSHNGQELNDFLISQMSKQVYLTKRQFMDFIKCSIDTKQYEALLKEKNLL